MITQKTGILFACIVFAASLSVLQVSADTEANKALVNRLFDEVFNQGQLNVVDELVTPDFVHRAASEVDAEGPDGYKELIDMLRTAFPDLNVTVEDMMAESDLVATRQTYTGTHQGPFEDIPPTDVATTFTGICIFRIADGKIGKAWTEYDVLGLILQLGAMEPSPEWPPLNRQAIEDFIWTPSSDVTGDPGDPAANIGLVHRINDEVVNLGRAEVLDEIIAADFINHDPVWSVIVNAEDYKPWQAGFAQWPDGHQTIDLIFAEGDKVVSYWTYTWTEAAVGTVACPGIDIWRFADGKIVERWSGKDFFGMMQRMTPQELAEDYGNTFFMPLEQGLNMISLPLMPMAAYTARTFANEIGATVIIKYDEALGRFTGFDLKAPGEGFPIEGGKGYIVNVPAGGTVAFTGAAWKNEPSVEAAPPITGRADTWAFMFSGFLVDDDGICVSDGDYTITMKNLNNGKILTGTVDTGGYFSVAWADLSRKPVISSGHKLEITVTDVNGSLVSGPFIYEVTPDNIKDALASRCLKLGQIIPKQSGLLQNYPNPFNPETWIPFQLAKEADVCVKIYDASGKLVRNLTIGRKEAGVYTEKNKAIHWDGRNEAGEEVSIGIYYCSITAGNFSATRKMIVKK